MAIMVVRTDSRRAGDQAVQTCQRGEGAEWIKVKPSKAELHQEITLVYICRIRMRLYVIKSLNDINMSNNF